MITRARKFFEQIYYPLLEKLKLIEEENKIPDSTPLNIEQLRKKSKYSQAIYYECGLRSIKNSTKILTNSENPWLYISKYPTTPSSWCCSSVSIENINEFINRR
jgi:hypothetical protein